MPTTSMERSRRRTATAAALGLLLVGSAATPAHAESIRDRQWHLDAMKAEQMWQTSTGTGITVAVIDTGVDATFPSLQGQVLPGRDLAKDSPGDEHTDYKGHGTIMADLIAGTGQGNGSFGLAPGVKVLPIRKTDRGWDAARHTREFSEEVSAGIRYAADSGAQIINISLQSFKGSDELADAVRYALDKGSLIFAGTGNDGTSDLGYPAATPGVVGVGAVGKDLRKTAESQYGPRVDLAAPGDEMFHACVEGTTDLCKAHGTSAASALASASAALIWSKHPDWTNNQVLRVMLNTIGGPSDGAERNDHIGYGIVRPRIALKTPGDPGPADEYPLPDLAAAAPKSPSPEASEPAADNGSDDKQTAAETSSSKDDSDTTLWLGLGAAGLLVAAVATAVVRNRRRDSGPGHVA